jgi:hypothetical protein
MKPPTRSQNSSPTNRTKQPSGFESDSSLNHFVKKMPGNLSSRPATNSPTTLKNRSSRKFKLHLANSSGIRGPADPSLMLTTIIIDQRPISNTGPARWDFPIAHSVVKLGPSLGFRLLLPGCRFYCSLIGVSAVLLFDLGISPSQSYGRVGKRTCVGALGGRTH